MGWSPGGVKYRADYAANNHRWRLKKVIMSRNSSYDLLQLGGKSSANQISAAVFVKITNGGNMEPDRHQFVREKPQSSATALFLHFIKKRCRQNIYKVFSYASSL